VPPHQFSSSVHEIGLTKHGQVAVCLEGSRVAARTHGPELLWNELVDPWMEASEASSVVAQHVDRLCFGQQPQYATTAQLAVAVQHVSGSRPVTHHDSLSPDAGSRSVCHHDNPIPQQHRRSQPHVHVQADQPAPTQIPIVCPCPEQRIADVQHTTPAQLDCLCLQSTARAADYD